MRSFLAWTIAILAGLTLGALSAWACLQWSPSWYQAERDGWRLNRAYGAPAAGPYMRAAAATRAFSPQPDEISFYLLDHDETGAPLSESCIYEAHSEAVSARWWSLALYAKRGGLSDNGDHAMSLDADRAALDGQGGWTVRLSPVRGEAANWLSTRDRRNGFMLGFRLYQPRPDIEGNPPALPRLQTLSCTEPRA